MIPLQFAIDIFTVLSESSSFFQEVALHYYQGKDTIMSCFPYESKNHSVANQSGSVTKA